MMKYAIKNQLKQAEMQGHEAQITQEATGSRKMLTQSNKKQLKQFKNQSQTEYMQNNESQITDGEARKKEMQIRQNKKIGKTTQMPQEKIIGKTQIRQDRIIENQSQNEEMMIKNTQNKKEISKNESMLSEQYIHKKTIIQTHSQSGRSMVEMLGVLAIIAILSIGGIVGFRLAMNYYQANQIAHEMNMMRTDVQIKIAQGTEKLTLGEPYDSINESTLGHIQFNDDYPVDFACALADEETVDLSNISCHVANAYYIELQNIPEGVCKPLAELVNGMNNIIAFNVNKNEYPGEGTCEAGNGNVLNAVFSAEAVSELVACAEDTDCESENALYCDPSRHVCVRCYEDNQCEHNQYCEDNTCVTCESGVWNGEECVECTADDDCTDTPDTPVCNTAEYKCVECLTYSDCKNEERPQCDEASHTCKSCIDIDPEKPVWADTQCVECVNSSTDCEEELVCRGNECTNCQTEEECQEKGTTYHCSNASTCIQCDTNEVWDDESKECVECTEDNDCTDTPDTPKCNTTTNKCVECTTNDDCENPKPYCNPTSNQCAPCQNDSQCDTTQNEHCTFAGECIVCEDGEEWNSEFKECVAASCKQNSDCNTKGKNHYYCNFKSTDSCFEQTGFGTCVDKDKDKVVIGKYVAKKQSVMTRQSTKNFCAMHGKRMIKIADLDCAHNSSIDLTTRGFFYCHKDITQDVKSSAEEDRSPLFETLYQNLSIVSPTGPDRDWFFVDDSDPDSCFAYDIDLYSGKLSPYCGNDHSHFALCI